MAPIEWRSDFELGIPDVDHEHAELVNLINEALARLQGIGTAGSESESVSDFLGEIHARISGHFALEERFMREHGYDRHLEHKAAHEQLLDEIRELMDLYDAGEAIDVGAFAERLERWFTGHFGTEDARLHGRLG